jgi:hypothetical protein
MENKISMKRRHLKTSFLFRKRITKERRDEGSESGDNDEAKPPGTQPTLVTLLQF